MILASDFEDFVKLLIKHEVEYLIVGGYALAFHGKPRHTGDLDIWINISENNATRILMVLDDFGMSSMGLKKQDFLQPGYITQIGYPPLRIDILNSIDGVDFKNAIQNMNQVEVGKGFSINYIGLRDFVKNKQAVGRSQDLVDIQEIQKIKPVKKVPGKKKGKHL
jgi:predicted nucleotidyltransferase